ncbi:MAG: hypothetical protein PHV74_11900, partial [Dehalococcoidia bacterium]|nr:hypothetical protein [Dehalococcoidia bacterium]
MGLTTTSTLSDTMPKLLEAARFTEMTTHVMRQLAWVINKPLHSGTVVYLPYFSTATASDLTEGVDMSSAQSMADTAVTVTPREVGAQILLTDKLIRDNNEDIIKAAGRILGNAMITKLDTDLTA